MKRTLFILIPLLIVFLGSCTRDETVEPSIVPEIKNYIHISHTRTSSNPFMDSLVERIDFSKFDMLWLGGDLAHLTSQDDYTMAHVDSVFDVGNINTLWSLGNHDYSDLNRIQNFTNRPPFYSYYKVSSNSKKKTNMNINTIIEYIDEYLTKSGRQSIDPVKANNLLEKAGLLRNSIDRPGKPLRDLLRKGRIPHAFQSGGKGSKWTIPHSKNGKSINSNYSNIYNIQSKSNKGKSSTQEITSNDFDKVAIKIEKARQKYLPKEIKCLLIAEAPPDSLNRFFYFEDVKQHDYLFLGVAQAMYPELKNKFLESKRDKRIKELILKQFRNDGFFLLDLSDLPLSLLKESLENQLPRLKEKIEKIANKQTPIILIKTSVYDITYSYLLEQGFRKVINYRIPFPGQGGQRKFQAEFIKAVESLKNLRNRKEYAANNGS